MSLNVLVEALPFAAEYEGCGAGVIDIGIELRAALVKAINPKPGGLQPLQRLSDVANANHRQVFQSSGGSFGDRFGETGGAALRQADGIGAGGMRGANNRPEVMRILHAVQYDDQFRSVQDILEFAIPMRSAKSHDALMGCTAGRAVQRLAWLEADGDGLFPAEIDNLLQALTARPSGD